jgi:hypothetical protein
VLFATQPRDAIPAIANGFNNFFIVLILAGLPTRLCVERHLTLGAQRSSELIRVLFDNPAWPVSCQPLREADIGCFLPKRSAAEKNVRAPAGVEVHRRKYTGLKGDFGLVNVMA